MAIYTFDFSEEENWVLNDATISDGTLNITASGGYGQRSPDANWLSGANDNFEIEFDFRIDGMFQTAMLTLKLDEDAIPIIFWMRTTYNYIKIYYDGVQRGTLTVTISPTTWYTGKVRRVGTTYYFSINGGTEISWDYGTTRALEYLRLIQDIGTGGTKFDNFIYRWIEEGIIKTFQDSGVGTDNLLVDKTLIFPDSGIGTDKWVLPNRTYIVFSDTGVGIDAFKVDKTLVFSDTGSGIDIFKIDKTVVFSDIGEGVDVFLVDKEVIFKDVASAIDKFRASYPYPRDLKRKIIIIRDIK